MSRRRNYSDSPQGYYGYDQPDSGRTRVDMRPQGDPHVQAGMRGLHRDTGGNVIGGYTAEGQALGTKDRSWRQPGAVGYRAGNPKTPGLDNLAAMQNTTPGESLADAEKRKRMASAASGAFGKKPQAQAQNLAGRQSLFKDMQTAGKTGLNVEMSDRATKLGVDDAGWKRAVAKIPQTGNIAAAAPPQSPSPAGSLTFGYGNPSWKTPTAAPPTKRPDLASR